MNKADMKIVDTADVPESANYFEAKADTIVSISTNVEGDEFTTFVFLDNYPVVGHIKGELTVTSIEKRRVASVSVSTAKARKFYESLKSVFEDN